MDLQIPLAFISQLSGVGEVRVAQGVYHPAGPGGDRYESFTLINGLTLQGGYAGSQNANPDERDVSAYPTILSGDLNDDDEPDFINYQDNSYHVVVGKNLGPNTVLDGFVIAAGNANGMSIHANGGGLLN